MEYILEKLNEQSPMKKLFLQISQYSQHIQHMGFLVNIANVLTLFRMGFFGAAHGWGAFLPPPSLKSATHILQ